MRSTIFSKIPYFQNLSDSDLLEISGNAQKQPYHANQVVILQGEKSIGLHIVESGWLKAIKTSSEGREQVLHFLAAGDVFNAVAVFTETPNQASIIALEDSVIWTFTLDQLKKILDFHPLISQNIIHDLANRMMHLVNLVEDLSLRSVEARLSKMLLEESVNHVYLRHKWATQNEMAARIGTVPDVLNRILRNMQEEGVLSVKRNQIQILNSEVLAIKAELV